MGSQVKGCQQMGVTLLYLWLSKVKHNPRTFITSVKRQLLAPLLHISFNFRRIHSTILFPQLLINRKMIALCIFLYITIIGGFYAVSVSSEIPRLLDPVENLISSQIFKVSLFCSMFLKRELCSYIFIYIILQTISICFNRT